MGRFLMSHIQEVELIKKRSKIMLKEARGESSKGHYDLAVFLAEQAVQLYLKAVILSKTGTMSRTHTIRDLMGALRIIYPHKTKEIDNFVKQNRSLFIRLEETYISSRYLFREYTKDEAEELVKFAEEVIKFVRDIEVSNATSKAS